MQPDHQSRQLKLDVVAKANAVWPTLTDDFTIIEALVRDHDIVWVCWQDLAESDGVGMVLVKGQEKLRGIVASQKPEALAWTAIPCSCAEQAVALQQVAGEPDRLH